jgi:tetratricopeptide (TPR) repeat protein
MVTFVNGTVQMTMNRDAFEYTYGDADGPDPTQQDLDDLLPRVTRVCVLEGAMLQGRTMGGPVLLDTHDVQAIQDLANCLQIVEDPRTFGHCSCLGGPTIELYAGPEHIATIGLQHGRAIRWKQWYHDAQLQAGDRLTRWLHDQGIDPSRLEAIYQRGDHVVLAEPNTSSVRRQEAQQLCAQAQERAREGNFPQALELSTRALELDPDAAEAYAVRGQISLNAGQLLRAAADCSAGIDRGLRQAEAYVVRAMARDGEGRVEEALADCSMALHLNPDHAGAYNSRGSLRGRLGRLEEARQDFDEAIRLEPKWFLPRLHRAQLAHGRGQLDAALSDYDAAVELATAAARQAAAPPSDPTVVLVYCRRGEARLDRFGEARAEADFAAARRRHAAVTAGYLGDMWLRRNSLERARQEFTHLIQLRPEDPQGYLGRGLAQEARGDLEQDAADYSAAIHLQPDVGACYLLRARVRNQQGLVDQALADLAEHLCLHPKDVMGYLYRYSLHRDRKAWTEARADLNLAYSIAPDHPEVCNCLAWMLATRSTPEVQDGPRAVALARQACEATQWKQPHILDTFAATLAATNVFDEAIHWQTQAVQLSTDAMKPGREARLKLYEAGQPYRE